MAAAVSLIRRLLTSSRLWPLLVCSLLLVAGCSDPLREENERLRNQIIAVHDQAMDKIG